MPSSSDTIYSQSVGRGLIELYFDSDPRGGQLVKHQIQSFNDFIANKISNIMSSMNPIDVSDTYLPEHKCYQNMLSIEVANPTLALPMIYEKDGSSKVMFPNDARLRNMTYSSNLTVDLHILTRTFSTETSDYTTLSKEIRGVSLGRIPLMVRSKYCMTSIQSVPADYDECRYDYGGYFIVNGNEKVVISQDRIAENRTYVFVNNAKTSSCYSLMAEVRSVKHSKFSVPKTTLLKLSKKSDEYGCCIRVTIYHIKADIPLFVLFRAFGILSDKEIVSFIMCNNDDGSFDKDERNAQIVNELIGCIEEGNIIKTQQEAFEFLSHYVQYSNSHYTNGNSSLASSNRYGPSGSAAASTTTTINPQNIQFVANILMKDIFPHVGSCYRKKAIYLGYMVNKLISCNLGLQPFDDRDSYVNKRLDTPGILLANLFRQYYCKVIKDMRSSLHNLAKGEFRPTKLITILTKSYMHKIIKSSVIESGLKYGLSTGNWGMKSTRVRQGVAQVLNRMTYIATLSHLRRVNTAIEKTGKLVQPRKLHPTQWGMVCPSETPEGASVGLVKNLSILTNITIHSSPKPILNALHRLGTVSFFGAEFHNNMQSKMLKREHSTLVIVNGDIVGTHPHPEVLFQSLKTMKRCGDIDVFTSVTWNVLDTEITICTEGGRFCRPVLIVYDGNRIALTPELMRCVMEKKVLWTDLVLGVGKCTEPVIEYIDVQESNHTLIAMNPAIDLTTSSPKKYTHAEIDPSVILGIVAGSIPFSDHNQAPRNTYQSAMGKQAVGIFASNFRHRMDTMSLILNYPQEPLVSTHIARIMNCDRLPCGVNVIVAIACFTGFNQEDSVIMSRSAVERGLFVTTMYRTFREQNNKNHSTGEEETFCRPNPLTTRNMKPYKYGLLDSSGFVPDGTFVDTGDIIIGKCMPQKQGNVIINKDMSVVLKNNERGYVDRNYHGDRYFTNTTGDGYTFAKVRIRNERVPSIGDKVSCYTPDHDVLTSDGWVPIANITSDHHVATLVVAQSSTIVSRLQYLRPRAVMSYNYKGPLYSLQTDNISLLVTPNHRMFVNDMHIEDDMLHYHMETAENIVGMQRSFKKDVSCYVPEVRSSEICMDNDGSFVFKVTEYDIEYSLDSWLMFYGLWLTKGEIKNGYKFVLNVPYANKVNESKSPAVILDDLSIDYDINTTEYFLHISNHIGSIGGYLMVLGQSPNLPPWVWSLNTCQSKKLVFQILFHSEKTMVLPVTTIITAPTHGCSADDFQRLCFHAGLTCDILQDSSKLIHKGVNKSTDKVDHMHDIERQPTDATQMAIIIRKNMKWSSIDLMKPHIVDINHMIHNYNGNVHCVTAGGDGPGVIYVRRKGCAVWCGNSRHGQKGTIGMLYSEEDMPFTENGIVPSIIMNPHAIPSRMTIGQLMEALESKLCSAKGVHGDASPFNGRTVQDIADELVAHGMEQYGDEIMYNPRTGEQMPCKIFVCPTYYQRLKHMVEDKVHCLTEDHDVLTECGWKPITTITLQDRVATLSQTGFVEYASPDELICYPNYSETLYHIRDDMTDIIVTGEHKMPVHDISGSWDSSSWHLLSMNDIIVQDLCNKVVFKYDGLWACDHNDTIKLSDMDAFARKLWEDPIGVDCGIDHSVLTDGVPKWAFKLSSIQTRIFIYRLCGANNNQIRIPVYAVDSPSDCKFVDDIMHLALHADITVRVRGTCESSSVTDSNSNSKCIVIDVQDNIDLKMRSAVVARSRSIDIIDVESTVRVYCLKVPGSVFYVRRNGCTVWTGNSRAANGPVVLLTRQPAEGRARDGGLRLGEMEMECLWAHGAMSFLKERFIECSDNYKIFVCKECGMIAHVNPVKSIYHCKACKNITRFSEVRIPYAGKLLIQEIQTMGIATRLVTDE